MQMNQPRRLFKDDEKKIVVIGFCHRDPGGDSERADDLRQRVGMPNHEHISRAGFQLCDQRL